MLFAVLKETASYEKRVALTPESAKKLMDMGHSVTLESQAGLASGFEDEAFKKVGCHIESDPKKILKKANALLTVNLPESGLIKELSKGSLVLGMFKPHVNQKEIKSWAKSGVSIFSLELLPRITRAQVMDVLSSQSNLAGYKAVVNAAALYGRAMPLMMTAAGTVAAARVLILGAGVAGLQSIATARRMGAIVSAFDVRPAAKEQVESLGAKFIQVPIEESGDGGGGYAKEMSEEYKKAQAQLLADTIKTQDIVITTAQIPGKSAPILITKEMVHAMKAGSIIVDLASESGGNCALTKHGESVKVGEVTIIGPGNMPSEIAGDASQLYARNLLAFIKNLMGPDGKELTINWDDEIIKATALVKEGELIHPIFE
jgi:NAD(P) transhydrogenase subunit alpha